MCHGTGLAGFAKQFPKRYFDVGIAEGHAVCMAAGLAKQGMIPVFAVYSTFLQRSYDMLLHDVALLHLHVVLAVDRAGLVGEDGETHHGLFDTGFLRHVAGMQIFCPASQAELQRMLRSAVLEMTGPVAVRYPKGGDGSYTEGIWQDHLATDAVLSFLTYGTTINFVLKAAEMLKKDGISSNIFKLDQIKPLDLAQIEAPIRHSGRLLIVEEAARSAGIGMEVMARCRVCGRVLDMGDGIVPHGDLASLRHLMGMDAEGIYQAAKELLQDEA